MRIKTYPRFVENPTYVTLAEIFRILKKHYIYIAAGLLLLAGASCGNNPGTSGRGPIRLGDSSGIVTEKDSQFLKDDVMDIEPHAAGHADTGTVSARKETTPAPVKDTATQPVAKKQPEEAGHAIDFNGTHMVFAGLKLKDARRQNAAQDDGLSYSLDSGNPETAKLLISGAKNVTVKQRYQTKLVLKSSLGTVDLRDLGLYTSGWNTVKAAGSAAAPIFSLSSLSDIDYNQVNNNKIKNAVDRELRKRRTSSRVIQNWMKEIRKVRDASDEPCDIILDNVQWQISGTDAKGKAFHKTIRLDA